MKIKFIKSSLDSLPFTDSKDKRMTYYDSQTPYLVLRVSHNRKSFYYYRKLKQTKSPIKDKIGDYPDISIRQAQDQVKQISTKIINGTYFHKSGMFFSELFDKYYLLYSKKHKRRHEEDKRKYDVYLKSLYNKPCDQLTVKEMNELHAKVGTDNGQYMANRVIALVRGIFNWGLKQQLIKCDNPAKSIKKFAEKSRDRFMDVDEFKRFFEALESPDINENMRDYFKVLIFTGARKSNVMSMRWEDLRFENKTWTIPGESYKNGEPFTAVLVDCVMDILEKRKKNTTTKYVFPSPTSVSGHMEEPKKAWLSILKKAKIENLRIHDLRRTLGSWQAIGGSSLLVIGESLGQKTTKATEVYARLNKNVVRESVNNATSAMLRAIATPTQDENTTPESEVDRLKSIINNINTQNTDEFKKLILEEIFRK